MAVLANELEEAGSKFLCPLCLALGKGNAAWRSTAVVYRFDYVMTLKKPTKQTKKTSSKSYF